MVQRNKKESDVDSSTLPASVTAKSNFMILLGLCCVNIQPARKACSISPESVLNFSGIDAQLRRFCRSISAAYADIKKEIPAAVKDEVKKQLSSNQVEIQIDKQSFKKAQKAIEDLFNPFKRWKK